jgi:hypothetical protein
VALAAGVDLHRRGPGLRRAVGIEPRGEIAVNHGHAPVGLQGAHGALDQRGLARAG